MPVPSTNTKFSDIQTEFGGSNPIQLSEYYSGGPLVPAGSPAPNGPIPSAGQISVGQFRASAKALEADYLVISGGGAGSTPSGGGAGAGGVRFSADGPTPLNTGTKLSLSFSTVYPVVVGAGGTGGFYKPPIPSTRGSDSIFNPGGSEGVNMITTEGGGTQSTGIDGGSGGGQPGDNGGDPGGAGNTPPFSPPQGQPGGAGTPGTQASAGGGGTGAAGNPGGSPSGNGGAGVPNSLPGSPTYYGGGGGGGSDSRGLGSRVGSGGIGGGGGGNGGNGTANTGGGGGGGFFHPDGGPESKGGNGGSGMVKIRVPACAAPSISVSPPTNTVTPHPGGGSVANFTVSGNLTVA